MNATRFQRGFGTTGHAAVALWAVVLACLLSLRAAADVTVFFDSSQIATLVATGATWDTISSDGYLFTYTRDKLFTGGVGLTNPIGRSVRIPWPQGVEAQAVTTGPVLSGAKITIKRVDGGVFDLTSFTAHLLANTAGAGGSIEIMPSLNGQDAFNDPLYFDATGIAGNEFSYNTSPNYLGSTALLTNYDTYTVSLYVDYALTALTLGAVTPTTNHAPTDIGLSNAGLFENEPPGSWIGTLSTTDPDAGDTFSYALVAGPGDTGNSSFEIVGGDLYSMTSFNYEVQSNYSILVESTDQGFLSTQKVFLVDVWDVDETPVLFGLDMADGTNVVVTWSSVTNHQYAIHCATDLMAAFSAVDSNLAATPLMNTYTDTVQDTPARFWMITTVP